MELLPSHLKKQMPPLYGTEKLGLLAPARVKFFMPDGYWKWYASEFDGEDHFFGLVAGHEVELGYFALSELKNIRGSLGLPIERDLYFKPMSLGELQEMHKRSR